jgi:hypothetical protein
LPAQDGSRKHPAGHAGFRRRLPAPSHAGAPQPWHDQGAAMRHPIAFVISVTFSVTALAIIIAVQLGL